MVDRCTLADTAAAAGAVSDLYFARVLTAIYQYTQYGKTNVRVHTTCRLGNFHILSF